MHYRTVRLPGASPLGAGALTHGFTITFYVLAAIAAVGGLVAALLIESAPAEAVEEPAEAAAMLEAA